MHTLKCGVLKKKKERECEREREICWEGLRVHIVDLLCLHTTDYFIKKKCIFKRTYYIKPVQNRECNDTWEKFLLFSPLRVSLLQSNKNNIKTIVLQSLKRYF